MAAPLKTQKDLDLFAARTNIDGKLHFTRDIDQLLPGQTAHMLTERQLRQLGGGDTRITARVVYGPVTREELAKREKTHPFSIIH